MYFDQPVQLTWVQRIPPFFVRSLPINEKAQTENSLFFAVLK